MDFNTIIELDGLKLSEDGPTWLHAMPYGTYNHPKWGIIEFTQERLSRFVDNIRNKVRGIDPDIDYDHKADPAKGNKAAGWIKDARIDPSGLWIAVEWTPDGWQAVQNKEYRYLSPEFIDEWKHEKTGVSYKDVLFGAALTNRPFLKDLLPISMSEIAPPGQESEKELSERVERLEREFLALRSQIMLVDTVLDVTFRKEVENGTS